jgi:DNA-3-methyladenine glycosylase II
VDSAYETLLARDPKLRELAATAGTPDPFAWVDGGRTGSSNFAAMVLHIVGQQISTTVAFVLFDRLRDAAGGLPDPHNISALSPDRMRSLGLSRAKAGYLLALADAERNGGLDIEHLDALADADVIARLTAVRGIGLWSAEMFLLHQLRRPDVLPAGDMGIRRAVQAMRSPADLPTIEDVRQTGLAWVPYRSYAAALLWASLQKKLSVDRRLDVP